MSNIVAVSFKAEVNESLVEFLEDALQRAKSGELVSGKMVCTTANGEIATLYSSTQNAILELAAIARLLHRAQVAIDRASDEQA